MTTSGITSWPLTAEELVTQAMVELGAIDSGGTPSGEEMEDGLLRLNGMLKTWQGEGNLFREVTATLTISANTASATLPAAVRDVSSVRHVVSATYNRQLAEWTRAQYYSLPNRTSSGNPASWYAARTISGLAIYVWPVPTADIILELDYNRVGETVTDPSETVDVPEEWQETVLYGLASRLASMFGVTRIDPNKVARIDQKAAGLYQKMLDRDRPDSYYFEPDC